MASSQPQAATLTISGQGTVIIEPMGIEYHLAPDDHLAIYAAGSDPREEGIGVHMDENCISVWIPPKFRARVRNRLGDTIYVQP